MECLICKSNSGEKRISPGPTIFEGQYWFVEHAYPVKTIGWIVIVLKRHAEALHELTTEEFMELAQIQAKLFLFCMKNSVLRRNISLVMRKWRASDISMFTSLRSRPIFQAN